MSDPYSVLGLARNAEEAEIRQRYLELVKKFSPDRDPAKFAEIRAAYDRVRDSDQRLEAQIFDIDSDETLETIAAEFRVRLRNRLNQAPIQILLALAETP